MFGRPKCTSSNMLPPDAELNYHPGPTGLVIACFTDTFTNHGVLDDTSINGKQAYPKVLQSQVLWPTRLDLASVSHSLVRQLFCCTEQLELTDTDTYSLYARRIFYCEQNVV